VSLELATWLVVWTVLGPVIAAPKPVRIIEYDCDQEFRHLGYTASILGSSRKAESALREMAVRAAETHACKPALRLCGVNDDLQSENGVLGPATGVAREGTVAGTGHEAEANGTLEADINLGWLPELGRTQALSDRAAAYDDTGRCAYHLSPYGCTLVDGDVDGPGLTELSGLTPAKLASVPPEAQPDAPTQLLGALPRSAPTDADQSTEVRKRSANLMAWCERCATGIHIRCANDHTIGHGGDGCIGA